MPFRSRENLESWLDEFRRLEYPAIAALRAVELDGEDGATTGIVALKLTNAGTTAFVQPYVDGDSSRWVLTFESREEDVELSAAGVGALAAELMTVSALVAFLQAKSELFLQQRRG